MMHLHKTLYFLLACCLLTLAGCDEEEFLDLTNPNAVDQETFWQSPEAPHRVIAGAYSWLRDGTLYGDFYDFYPNLTVDDWDHQPFFDWQELKTLNVLPITRSAGTIWAGWYGMIARCNDALENIPQMPAGLISAEEERELMAQAYFLRGFAYFRLLQLYGEYYPDQDRSALGVIIYTEVPRTEAAMFQPRSTVQETYERILADLEQAAADLPEAWTGQDLGRATRYAALAMKGHVHLWFHEWPEAEAAYRQVIESGRYQLIEDYGSLFDGTNENNAESIFEVQASDLININPQQGGPGTKYPFRHSTQGNGNSWVSDIAADRFWSGRYVMGDYFFELMGNSNLVRARLPGQTRRVAFEEEFLQELDTTLRGVPFDDLESFRDALVDVIGQDYWVAFESFIVYSAREYDPRFKHCVYRLGDKYVERFGSSDTIVYNRLQLGIRKYIPDEGASSAPGEVRFDAGKVNINICRYADVLLTYAEALHELGRTDEAIGFINQVRRRAFNEAPNPADFDLPTGLEDAAFRAALKQERYRELYSETHYLHDLIRWGIAAEELAYKGFQAGKHEVLPIPIQDMEVNQNLVQNSGY